MRIFHPLCALVLAAAAPAALLAQDSAPSGAAPTTTAAAKKAARQEETRQARGAAPAKELFGAAKTPAPLAARSIGFYAKGCLAGAAALPIDGPAWQAMRLSRNRNWGHPKLIALVEKLARRGQGATTAGRACWSATSPSRAAGPMLTGHASHQVGLDADIWLTPMPDRAADRPGARGDVGDLDAGRRHESRVDPKVWTTAHVAPHQARRLLSGGRARASSTPRSRRRCARRRQGQGSRAGWQGAAYWGHHYHFHIRIGCPDGSANCEAQPRVGRRRRLRHRAEELAGAGEAKPQKPKPEVPVRPASQRRRNPASRSSSCPRNARPCWRAGPTPRSRPRCRPRRQSPRPQNRRRRSSCPRASGVGFDADADRAAEARAAETAIAVRHLGQVLLVIVLGEVELRRVDDLGRDRRRSRWPTAPSDRRPSTPPPLRAAPRDVRRCRSDTACRRRCPGACPASGRGSPRTS